MAGYVSTHLPEVAGGIVEVTGETIIETGLRNVVAVQVSFAEVNLVPNEEGHLTWYFLPDDPKKIVIRVEKTGTNSGDLGDNPVRVSFLALGA